jgi:tetratricopeptide (TPR) repeat protein
MEININNLSKQAEELFNQKKFDEITALLTDEVLKEIQETERDKAAELYIQRGNAWYNKQDYNKAITDYDKAIEFNPNYELAYYNRGLVWFVEKKI